jgi:hypothetical protein
MLGALVLPALLAGGRAGSAVAHTAASPPVAYPLKDGPTGRYLVDQRGRPFLVVGDSPQSMVVNLSLQDARSFIVDRKEHGFNALWINVLCNTYTGGRADGSTYDHIPPFLESNDLSTPNPGYFSRVDAMVRLAGQYGMVVFLDPIETGGWLETLEANGPAKAFAYGRYLGKRYSTFPNIVWMNGNDFQQWNDVEADSVVLAVAQGIRSADPRHLQTIELNYTVSSSTDDARWRPLLGLNAAYTYGPTYAEIHKDYDRKTAIPILMVEAGYEFEQNSTSISYGEPWTLRRQEYWSLLSGASGQFYGNHYTWQFLPGWKSRIDTLGSRQMSYLVKLFRRVPWYRLVPDQKHTLLTRGYGTFTSTGNVDDSNYATAARTPDGKLAIAYLPTVRTITIDSSRLAARPTARWYDPTAGTFRPAAPLTHSGSIETFRPPDKNAAGDGDWLLVLTSG